MGFAQGDIVLYGQNGACVVKAIEERDQGEYYILTPVHKQRTTLMVPAGNDVLVSRMRPIPSAAEVEESIRLSLQAQPIWIEDTAARKDHAKDVLANGNEFDLLMLRRSFHEHREHVLEQGKKSTSSDASILRNVQDRIRDVFSLVFDIEPGQVDDFIGARAEG